MAIYVLHRHWFFAVDNSAEIARSEVFGPVLVILPYTDEAEALAIANDSDYGLSGSVFSSFHRTGDGLHRPATGRIGDGQRRPLLRGRLSPMAVTSPAASADRTGS